MTTLSHDFFDRHPVEVARELLGRLLVRRTTEGSVSGRIVEVEAYLFEDDPACHATRGQTRSNRAMFGPPGRAYVYPIHSRFCLNAVTEREGVASAVLVRAVDPVDGIELMRSRRRREKLVDLTRGPGRLCEAFQIDRRLDRYDLAIGRRLWISQFNHAEPTQSEIGRSRRIGVTSGSELQLRFFLISNPFVSGPRRLR